MSEMHKVLNGLDILYRYKKPGQNAFCCTEGDYLYGCGPSPRELSEVVIEHLADIGWTYDENHGCWKHYIN